PRRQRLRILHNQVMPNPGGPGFNELVSLAPIEEQVASPKVRSRGITRRQALAAAAATGVGVGVVRLLGGSMQQIAAPRPASATNWVSPLKSESARVMQLLRRTSFGYPQAQIASSLADGDDRPGHVALPGSRHLDRPEPQRKLLPRADGALHYGRGQLHRR